MLLFSSCDRRQIRIRKSAFFFFNEQQKHLGQAICEIEIDVSTILKNYVCIQLLWLYVTWSVEKHTTLKTTHADNLKLVNHMFITFKSLCIHKVVNYWTYIILLFHFLQQEKTLGKKNITNFLLPQDPIFATSP